MKSALRIASSTFVILLLSGCSTFQGQPSAGSSSSLSSSVISSNAVEIPNGWERYVGPDVSFAYPEELVSVSPTEPIVLSHSVPSKHMDPCDFKGDAPELQVLTDFHVKIETSDMTLVDAASERMHWIADDKELFVKGDKLVPSEGFIEEVSYPNVKGYQITQGVEGCGQKVLFVQNAAGNVAIVTRKIITELSNAITNTDEYMKLPGVIKPDEEEEIFQQFMSSFTVQ